MDDKRSFHKLQRDQHQIRRYFNDRYAILAQVIALHRPDKVESHVSVINL